MIFCTKTHDVKRGGSIGEEHVMNLFIIGILIREVHVIGVIIELYLCICILRNSHCLVE